MKPTRMSVIQNDFGRNRVACQKEKQPCCLPFGKADDAASPVLAKVGLSEKVHFLHFLAFVFALTALLMLAISRFRPARQTYVQEHTHAVDITPWKHARLFALLISLAAVLFYVLMAQ